MAPGKDHTDFLRFEKTPGVSVRYEERPESIGVPDIVFIPGSKNTLAGLEFIKSSGWSKAITGAVKKKIPVFGLCGGYQMLGEIISDPHKVESDIGTAKGLGLLPVRTVLAKSKHLSQTTGLTATSLPFAPIGSRFHGYEIHMGVTESASKKGKDSMFLADL